MKSVMAHNFAQTPSAEIQRSSFDRSHGLKTTFNANQLIPVFFQESLPGDTMSVSMTGFARLATPIKPIMDNMFMETFFFDIPLRLVWENWGRFNGAQDDPGDSTDFLIPTLPAPAGGFTELSLYDYFGLPTKVDNFDVSALFFRAYALCYNEWFRDENLIQSVPISKDDGPDADTDYKIYKRGKRQDYFTSALPWPQKSEFGAVTLPLGQSAPVTGIAASNQTYNAGGGQGYMTGGTGSVTLSDIKVYNAPGADSQVQLLEDPNNPGFPGIFADLSEATSATINQLRQAFQIQKMYERDARGGTRLTEIILAHFNVQSPDARQQRPEYLGGGSSPININPVQQTQASDEATDTPQANLAATGTALLNNHGFVKSFTEHSIVLGMVCVRADLTYQNCLNKMWSRQTRFDFFWPALSHLGEVPILSKEIYMDGTANDEDIFGYQEKDAEYRFAPSIITGLFRSNATASLDVWHLSQDFGSRPTLGQQFIEDDTPIDRVIAVPGEPHFLFDSYFQMTHARPIPTYGTPGLIDHF